MTNSTGTMADPGGPGGSRRRTAHAGRRVAVTEASIIRLQAVKEVHLAVAHRLADEIGSVDGGAARGESAELAARSVAAELAAS